MRPNWDNLESLCELDALHSDGFSVALDVCRASFLDDRARLYDFMPLIADSIDSREQVEWGRDVARMFDKWRDDVPPTMPSLLAIACDYFDIPAHEPLFDVATAACVLSEVPNFNAFHNNHHFREVVTMVICFCAHHNQLWDDSRALSKEDILLLITAAAIHDFAHDGNGNIIDGHHTPSRLEIKAVNEAEPFLRAAGLSERELEIIRALVLVTDVSSGANGQSPSNLLRAIYRAHTGEGEMPDIKGPLSVLAKDRKTAMMGLIMGEADISPSTGLCYDFSQRLTVLVAAESSVLQPSANTLYGFMKHICHGNYMSPVARYLMTENFTAISLQAEQDAEENRLYA